MLPIARFFLLAVSWLGLLYFFSKQAVVSPVWVLIPGVALAGLPVLAYGLYRITVRRIHGLSAFQQHGILYRLLNGRLVQGLLWIGYSIVFGFVTLFWVSSFTLLEWTFSLLSVPIMLAVFLKLQRLTSVEFRPFMATHRALQLTAWSVPPVLTLVYLLALASFGPGQPAAGSLSAVMNSIAATPISDEASLLAQLAQRWADYYHQLRLFAFSRIPSEGLLPLLIVASSSLALFVNLQLSVSAFLIAPGEYRRVINPLADSDRPAPVTMGVSARATAVFVVLFFFVYVRLLVSVENALLAVPELPQRVSTVEQQVIRNVEQIEQRYFEVGTIAAIESARLTIDLALEQSRQQVSHYARQGFDGLRANVEVYLDHYYSLPAEYLRLAAMLTNNLEQVLQNELNETLMDGDPFAAYQQAIDELLATNTRLRDEYQASIDQLLAANEVEPGSDSFRVIASRPLDSLQLPGAPEIVLPSDDGTTVRAGAGAISAVIASSVVAKLTAKGSLKLAVQAMTKVAVAKSTSGAAGAAIGGAIGSIVPGAGTAAGAAIGAVVGILVGVSVDALLLQLEETLNRDEFRAQILAEIDSEEEPLLQRLTGTAEVTPAQ